MRVLVTGGIGLLAMSLAACTGSWAPSASSAAPQPASASAGVAASGLTPKVAHVATANWRLSSAVSRPVVLAAASGLVVAGGLDSAGHSTAAISTYAPASGHVVGTARLASAVHDAAGAVLGGKALVFGGGDTSVSNQVQSAPSTGKGRPVATLPRPRADLAAATSTVATVSAGTTTSASPTASPASQPSAYLVGGYDGTSADPTVLATVDGRTFSTVGQLPVAVRYPAIAVRGNTLWVMGGEVQGQPVDLIQRLNIATGRARVAGHLPRPLEASSAVVLDGQVLLAGGLTTGGGRMATVWRLTTAASRPAGVKAVAELPQAVSDMGAAVVGNTAYLVGGEAPATLATVVTVQLRPGSTATGASDPVGSSWLSSPNVPAYLAAGSNPAALPGDILIADKLNNRLIVVDPQGRVRWQFPRPGDLAPGQNFLIPDDAFFSPNGQRIIATQEDNYVISVIDIATHRLIYRYGRSGVPGSGPNRLDNPDDALLMPGGDILTADIKNCRLLRIASGTHRPAKVYGTTGVCAHQPPTTFGSPNGVFPLSNGNYLVTEINGAYVDQMTPAGKVKWSVKLPNVAYPSDSNQVAPGKFLTVDYSSPGQVLEFTRTGKVIWRWRPMGPQRLDHPSLALPLSNGYVLVTDDYHHRVLVVDPSTNRVLWQYGTKGVAGRAPGLLANPDGLDVLPPDQLISILSSH